MMPPIKPEYPLYRHQVEGYNLALSHMGYGDENAAETGGGYALFCDMGVGKTLVTIAVAGRLYLDGHINRVLIVCPSSVCHSWISEFNRFADYPIQTASLLGSSEKRTQSLAQLASSTAPALKVAVINYESAWRLESELRGYLPDMIVCDESQRIKNPRAQQSKAMHRLGKFARFRMILTGTPIQQDPRDLWSQYNFLDPGLFHTSYYAFVKRYCVFGGYQNHQLVGTRNLEELTEKAHSIAYRVKKEDCLDLPPKTFIDHPVELEPKAKKLYRDIQKESFAILDTGEEITADIILTRLLKLQMLTGGFVVDDDGNTQFVSTAKIDALMEIVESLCIDEGRKLVVFTRFRAELAAICECIERLLPKELHCVRIEGDVPIPKRGALVEQFQTDPATRVFLGNIDACAEGLTLHAADVLVYFSTTWNFAKYSQSQDRIHRIGQTKPCTYIHLIVPGTIDTRIMSALAKKENLARRIIDNWKELFIEQEDDS